MGFKINYDCVYLIFKRRSTIFVQFRKHPFSKRTGRLFLRRSYDLWKWISLLSCDNLLTCSNTTKHIDSSCRKLTGGWRSRRLRPDAWNTAEKQHNGWSFTNSGHREARESRGLHENSEQTPTLERRTGGWTSSLRAADVTSSWRSCHQTAAGWNICLKTMFY